MGLFDEIDDAGQAAEREEGGPEQGHLFQTVRRTRSSTRNYAKLFLIVVVFVVICGAAVFYLTMPGVGDEIRPEHDLDLSVRNFLLDDQKRVATDMTFYQCSGYFWVRAGVETRTDIENPIFRIGSYWVTAKPSSPGQWTMKAGPIKGEEDNKPCTQP